MTEQATPEVTAEQHYTYQVEPAPQQYNVVETTTGIRVTPTPLGDPQHAAELAASWTRRNLPPLPGR